MLCFSRDFVPTTGLESFAGCQEALATDSRSVVMMVVVVVRPLLPTCWVMRRRTALQAPHCFILPPEVSKRRAGVASYHSLLVSFLSNQL